MKTAYFDTLSGISGDMSLAALIDAGTPADWIEKQLNSLGIGPVELSTKEARKCGYRAIHIELKTQPETKHRHLHHIDAIIDNSNTLSDRAKATAKAIFLKLGEAEAKVHGSTLQKVHFHEVGAADSICDIVGVAAALDYLGIERLCASPVPTGHGQITIAHGTVNIPAPATAELLAGIPIRHCNIEAELTTPTGAAILKTLCTSFGPLPSMSIDKIGYGAGTRDLQGQANILRILIGHTSDSTPTESIAVMETQVDDMTGEELAFALERLRDSGAIDVFTTPIAMKKNRSGQLITVLTNPNDIEKIRDLLWEHTTTLGVRIRIEPRFVLAREEINVSTPWGDVRCKITARKNGDKRCSAEYADLARIAKEKNLPLDVVERKVLECFEGK
ncbi:MAG: nickel pincer cofactor biosynthesis protein LarC [Planctomycetaceae bacterium]|nr:nickel pincer cofactor biosynthesis protein LarC [Planctomycetaceae bacterium]